MPIKILKTVICLGMICGITGIQSGYCMEGQHSSNIIGNNINDPYTITNSNNDKYTISEDVYNTTAERLKTELDACDLCYQEIDEALKNYPNNTTSEYIGNLYYKAVYIAQYMLDLIANWKINTSNTLRNNSNTDNDNELLKTIAEETIVVRNYYEHFKQLKNKIKKLEEIKNEI